LSEGRRWTAAALCAARALAPVLPAALVTLAAMLVATERTAAQPLPAPAGPLVRAVAGSAVADEVVTAGGGSSTAQNPVVQFTTPGPHTVTLTVCNTAGCSTISQQVNVLNPMPAVGSAAAVPAQVYVGQPIHLSGQASGQPPLTYSWQILQVSAQGGSTPVQALSGQALTWSTPGLPAGNYSVQLTVSNASGSATVSVPVTLLAVVPNHFYTVTPCRLLDTRTTLTPLLAGAAARLIPVAGVCGIPLGARAVAINLTAVSATAAGAISVYPADYPSGFNNTIDFNTGGVRACGAVLPLSSDGLGELAATAVLTSGQVQLVIDVSGYFGP
jgi:PKD repeat protein